MDFQLLNFNILKHPMNWVIVLLMLMIFGLGVETLNHFYRSNKPSTQS